MYKMIAFFTKELKKKYFKMKIKNFNDIKNSVGMSSNDNIYNVF